MKVYGYIQIVSSIILGAILTINGISDKIILYILLGVGLLISGPILGVVIIRAADFPEFSAIANTAYNGASANYKALQKLTPEVQNLKNEIAKLKHELEKIKQ